MNPFTKRTPLQAPAEGEGASGGKTDPAATPNASGTGNAAEQKQDAAAGTAEADKKQDSKATATAADEAKAAAVQGDAGKGKEGEAKPADKAADAPLELKLPEGVEVDKALVDQFLPLAKEVGLSSEAASKLVAFHAATQKAAQEATVAAWTAQNDAWVAELKADKDFGGTKFEESALAAKKAIVEFGGQALADELNKFGLANNPRLARAFAKIGAALGEDTVARQSLRAVTTPKDTMEVVTDFYSKPQGQKQQ